MDYVFSDVKGGEGPSNVIALVGNSERREQFFNKTLGSDVWSYLHPHTRQDLIEAEAIWARAVWLLTKFLVKARPVLYLAVALWVAAAVALRRWRAAKAPH
jgi:hypothetical protein